MKTRYKNKRDFYKAEMEKAQRQLKYETDRNDRLQNELSKKKEDEKKKLKCTIYCSNCQKVYGAIVPNGIPLKESGCAYCGVRNTSYLVSEIK